jgi:hypothetical protein
VCNGIEVSESVAMDSWRPTYVFFWDETPFCSPVYI